MPPEAVLIVGAGLAGSRCAETLRAEGFAGRITVVGEEAVAPYERPALSKELLAGRKAPDDLRLRPDAFWAESGIVFLLGRRVETIDVRARAAVLRGGLALRWDALVLATGARARRILMGDMPAGVHHLRTLDDALALRGDLRAGSRLVVVGAGFVGAEVASTARGLGVDVTLIDVEPPFRRHLGAEVAAMLASRYREHGVRLELGTGLAGIDASSHGRVRSVILADGRRIPCDTVLVGVGAVPAAELDPSGSTGVGVAVDARGRTTVPGVYAAGDVASVWKPWLGARLRVEHWTGAAGQGAAVARAILGLDATYDDTPYFWSDQFGLRLQHVGHAADWAAVEIDGGADAFTVRYLDRQGRMLAALVANRPLEIGALRSELRAARVPLAA